MDKLNDLNHIKAIDQSDALGFAALQINQLKQDFSVRASGSAKIHNIVFGGMGGSSLCAELFSTWPGLKIPFEASKDYSIPSYVNSNTLCIISSFSGNTEETLSMLKAAQAAKAEICVITAGGRLLDIAQSENLSFYLIDHSIPQPRMAIMSFIKATATILVDYQISDNSVVVELEDCFDFLQKEAQALDRSVGADNNLAKQIAARTAGESVVVYSSNQMRCAGYKWKIGINENAKSICWSSVYPEFNHNEFIGWSNKGKNPPYQVVNLISPLDSPEIQNRFKLSDELLADYRRKPLNVHAKGDSALKNNLYLILLGDFVSLYLAVLEDIDPTPVDLVEEFKSKL